MRNLSCSRLSSKVFERLTLATLFEKQDGGSLLKRVSSPLREIPQVKVDILCKMKYFLFPINISGANYPIFAKSSDSFKC